VVSVGYAGAKAVLKRAKSRRRGCGRGTAPVPPRTATVVNVWHTRIAVAWNMSAFQ
jgi:hypothetical protein